MGETVTIDGADIELTHLDKVLYPDDGYTKSAVVKHVRSAAPLMLPHLEARALTLRRFPDGIGADGFFQKHASDFFPDWIETARIAKREGGFVDHVVCNDERTLVYLANLATLELHAPLARADQPDTPDLMIFDLDPPDDYDDRVRRAALALKTKLEARGLVPFVKSTGSRGFHVVAPLRRGPDFDAVREQARAIADALTAEAPDELTTAPRKDKRGGRVFVDILRNAYAQTAVAPYSLRARTGAPVAVPLDWAELARANIHPRKITIANLGRRMGRKACPWAQLYAAAKPLG